MDKIAEELISVIVPIYKIEQYIRKCIDSILNQTYRNLQIILVDDGSPDLCPAICNEYAKQDSRILVVHKENGGLSDARNVGIDSADGSYIAFVDGDDWLPANAYEYLYGAIREKNADAAFGVTEREYRKHYENEVSHKLIVLEKNEILDAYVDADHEPHILKAAWDKLYTRKLIGDTRFLNGKLYEDGPFNMTIMAKCRRCVFVGEVVYYYRDQREGSISSRGISEKLFTDKLPILRMQIEELKKAGREDLAERQLCVLYSEILSFYERIQQLGLKDKKNDLQRLRADVLNHKSEVKRTFKSRYSRQTYRLKMKLLQSAPALYRLLIMIKGKKK